MGPKVNVYGDLSVNVYGAWNLRVNIHGEKGERLWGGFACKVNVYGGIREPSQNL
jgi:hypothetical protein